MEYAYSHKDNLEVKTYKNGSRPKWCIDLKYKNVLNSQCIYICIKSVLDKINTFQSIVHNSDIITSVSLLLSITVDKP